MKKWILHILLFASLFGMLTTSCSQDEEVMQVGSTSGTVRIQFSLAMDGNAGSRAETWNGITGNDDTDGDVREVGSVYENTISLEHFQVFLFQNNRYLGEVGSLSLVDVASGTINKNKYTFRGEVTVHNATVTNNKLENATIMVVANYEGYVNGNLAITQNYIFDYIAENYRPIINGSTTTYGSYIPMWGMLKPANGIPLNESTNDTFTPIGDINMLRSLAKIEVVMGDEIDAGYTFTGATLGKYNKQANLLPSAPANSTYLAQSSTNVFNTENCKNPVSSLSDTSVSFNVSNDGKSCVLYVPEYSSSKADLQINLQISKNGTPISDKLQKKGTFTLEAKDLVRNHWYKCTVNEINDGYKMDLSFVVQDWTVVEESWDFTDHVSLNQGGELKFGSLKEGQFEASANQTAEVVTNGEDLYCQFGIATPTGAIWRAEFITVSGDKSDFVFVSKNENGQEVPTEALEGNVGTMATLVIRPTQTGLTSNNSVLLRISVKTIDGRTIVVKDLLPENMDVKEYTITHSI